MKERRRVGKGVEYTYIHITHTVVRRGGTDMRPLPVCGGDDKFSFVMCGVSGGEIKKISI